MKFLRDNNLIIIVPFVLILCLVPVIGVFAPDRLVSETENRKLTQFPVMDFSDVGQLTANVENYVVEQFPGREQLLEIYTVMELMQGKKLVRGTFIADGDWLLPREFKTTPEEALTFVSALGDFSSQYPEIPFFFAVLPHKTRVLSDLDQTFVLDEGGEMHYDYLISQLAKYPQIQTLDIAADFEALSVEERKKLYFKGDFHWNAYGAFFTVKEIQRGLVECGILDGGDLFTEDDFDFSKLEGTPYQGDLNRRFSNLFSVEETIPVIRAKEVSEMRYYRSVDDSKPVERGDIIGGDLHKEKVTYNDVYTENLGYYRVMNENAKTEKCILIFKDSLQNPSTDFFSTLFSEVDLIDARYYEEPYSIPELLDARRPDLILVMLHHDNYSGELAALLRQQADLLQQ